MQESTPEGVAAPKWLVGANRAAKVALYFTTPFVGLGLLCLLGALVLYAGQSFMLGAAAREVLFVSLLQWGNYAPGIAVILTILVSPFYWSIHRRTRKAPGIEKTPEWIVLHQRLGWQISVLTLAVTVALLSGWLLSQPVQQMQQKQRVNVAGSNIYWCGNMAPDAAQVIQQVAPHATQPSTLVMLNNEGGAVDVVSKVLHELPALGVSRVEAVGVCASACGLLWLEAPNRILATDSVIALHGPFESTTQRPSIEGRAFMKRILSAVGMEGDAIERFTHYPPDQAGWLGPVALKKLGVSFTEAPRPKGYDSACKGYKRVKICTGAVCS